ncbi:MAG: hypothetical protein V3V08_01895 [Nannocystaceae bacterium]
MKGLAMLLGCLAAPPSPGASPRTHPPILRAPATPAKSDLQAAISALPVRPSIGQAHRAALRRIAAQERTVGRWGRRVRRAALLPTLSAGYDIRSDRGWRFGEEPGEPDTLDSDAGASSVVRLKATWELDRLVFSLDELRAARAAADHHEWRQRLLVEVTQLYYERKRLLLAMRLVADASTQDAIERRVRLLEVEALLAALTGLPWPRR